MRFNALLFNRFFRVYVHVCVQFDEIDSSVIEICGKRGKRERKTLCTFVLFAWFSLDSLFSMFSIEMTETEDRFFLWKILSVLFHPIKIFHSPFTFDIDVDRVTCMCVCVCLSISNSNQDLYVMYPFLEHELKHRSGKEEKRIKSWNANIKKDTFSSIRNNFHRVNSMRLTQYLVHSDWISFFSLELFIHFWHSLTKENKVYNTQAHTHTHIYL